LFNGNVTWDHDGIRNPSQDGLDMEPASAPLAAEEPGVSKL
jgi:hypothetical protein